MIVSPMKAAGFGLLAFCLAGCGPPHDIRPPYHEPAAASQAADGDAQAPKPPAPAPR